MIVSATAFHWVDPEVRFSKPARLLRPGGWLAVLATREDYDDPFKATLLDMWIARSGDGGAWLKSAPPTIAEMLSRSELFGSPLNMNHSRRLVLPVEVVVGVENTRATSLSWSAGDQEVFAAEIRQHLQGRTEVVARQHTSVTMAQLLPRP